MAKPSPDYDQFMANQPLWSLAMHAGDSTPGRPRDAYAAELRVIADWLLPEEDVSDRPDCKESLRAALNWGVAKERQRLRKLLLAEADKANGCDKTSTSADQ